MHRDYHPHLKRLVIERHLRPDQAAFIHDNFGDSPGDLWAQPPVRELNEHTRAYIDELRGQSRSSAAFASQEGEFHG